ncbi:MAG TPA: hypothetical protein VL588_11385 [Bdellovibrionota bacterium]|nr:hypothetical protein [Bdellovibrionota bacterium]
MAEFLGVPLRTYARWESGKFPREATIRYIAKRAKIPEAALFQDPSTRAPAPLPSPPTPAQALDVLRELIEAIPPDMAQALMAAKATVDRS